MLPERVIVAVEGGAPTGGAERVAFDTVKVLSERGIPTVILSSAKTVDPAFSTLPGVEVICLDLQLQHDRFFHGGKAHMVQNLLFDREMLRKLGDILKPYAGSRTLLHVHGYHNFFSQAIFSAALKLNILTLVTCHDFGLVCPNAMLYQYPSDSICGLKPLSVACMKSPCMGPDAVRLKQLRYARAWGLRRSANRFHAIRRILAVSDHQRNILARSIAGRIDVLNNPVNPASSECQRPEDSHHYLWIGRMTAEKDPVTPANACHMTDKQITFVGDGPLETKVRAACPSALFRGWLGPEDVQREQCQTRALILSSRCYETASLVVLECLAAGIPCVVPDISAATSWVEDGVNGVYFKAGDIASLTDALKRLDSDEEVARMGRNAFTRYWKNPFTLERYRDELLAIYEGVLD